MVIENLVARTPDEKVRIIKWRPRKILNREGEFEIVPRNGDEYWTYRTVYRVENIFSERYSSKEETIQVAKKNGFIVIDEYGHKI